MDGGLVDLQTPDMPRLDRQGRAGQAPCDSLVFGPELGIESTGDR